MMTLTWQKIAFTFTLGAIAVVAGLPAQSQILTEQDLKPLPVAEGSVEDLQGTLAKDGSLWLIGVGGDGNIEEFDILPSVNERDS